MQHHRQGKVVAEDKEEDGEDEEDEEDEEEEEEGRPYRFSKKKRKETEKKAYLTCCSFVILSLSPYLQIIKEMEMEVRQATLDAKLEKKARRDAQEKRRAENQQKSLITQRLNLKKVDTKLRAMSKKQLRMIKKTKLNAKTGVVELVPAFEK